MPTPIANFTADNHLRPRTWMDYPELHSDAYIGFDHIVRESVAQHRPLLQLGDLFDKSRPDSESLHSYFRAISYLQDNQVPFYYLKGNHDNTDPALAGIHPWANPVAQLAIDGVRFYGIDYRDSARLKESIQSAAAAEADVILCHQSWKQIQRNGGSDGDFAHFPRATTMLTGDYHETGIYRGTAQDGGDVVAYSPGSTCMQATNEPAEKFYGVLHDDLSVDWVKIPSRPFMPLSAVNSDELDWIVDAIPTQAEMLRETVRISEIQKPIIRVTYHDDIPEAYNRLITAAGQSCFLFLNPVRPQRVHTVNEQETPENAFDSLLTATEELTPPGSYTRSGTTRLLRADDPATELEAMYCEYQHSFTPND